jgi:hypothetical protein
MAKCPACGVNLKDWHILTMGKTDSIRCIHCSAILKPQAKVSGIKVFLGAGFLLGGVTAGFSVAFGYVLQWVAFILIWFLLLALADIRYTHLEIRRGGDETKE